MADNVANLSRNLAITQLFVGFLLFCFGIGQQVVEVLVTHDKYLGISAGIWVSRTGGLLSNTFCNQGLVCGV